MRRIWTACERCPRRERATSVWIRPSARVPGRRPPSRAGPPARRSRAPSPARRPRRRPSSGPPRGEGLRDGVLPWRTTQPSPGTPFREDEVANWTGTCTTATAHRTSSTVMDASLSRCIGVPSTRDGRSGARVGRSRAATVNVPLPAGRKIYAAAFAGVFLPVLREYGPEVTDLRFRRPRRRSSGGMALGS